jgi:hypothetical protein
VGEAAHVDELGNGADDTSRSKRISRFVVRATRASQVDGDERLVEGDAPGRTALAMAFTYSMAPPAG